MLFFGRRKSVKSLKLDQKCINITASISVKENINIKVLS